MSVRIGIVFPKDYDLKLLENFKNKYNLSLIEVNNKYVSNQLHNDEVFLQATETGCDSLTGIGAYDLYTKDISSLCENIEEASLAQSIIDEFQERKLKYKEDALRWIEIINVLKYEYNVGLFGVFWHFCSGTFNEEKITFSNRLTCKVKKITIEYIMKIAEDVIVFFQ